MIDRSAKIALSMPLPLEKAQWPNNAFNASIMNSDEFNLEATLLAGTALETWQNDIKEGVRNIT